MLLGGLQLVTSLLIDNAIKVVVLCGPFVLLKYFFRYSTVPFIWIQIFWMLVIHSRNVSDTLFIPCKLVDTYHLSSFNFETHIMKPEVILFDLGLQELIWKFSRFYL